MKHITLTDQDGEKISGRIPEGWHEVLLSSFLNYHQQLKDKPEGFAWVVLASTTTDIPTEIIHSDVSLAWLILRQMPWVSELPKPEPLTSFKHQGKTYEHVGNLDKMNAGQFEALLDYLDTAKDDPIQAAPNLLAVLYKPEGQEQTKATVAAAAEAFQSLPVSIAWPGVAFFLTSSASFAQRIQAYSEAKAAVITLTEKIEKAMQAPSPTRSSRIAAWLGRQYMKSVRGLLTKS